MVDMLFRRRYPRVQVILPCRVSWPGHEGYGTTRDLSVSGIGVTLPPSCKVRMQDQASIHLPGGIGLGVHPVYCRQESRSCIVGFEVENIHQGELEWQHLIHAPPW